jgi:hypothetical protein
VPLPGPHGPVGSDNSKPTYYEPFWALSRPDPVNGPDPVALTDQTLASGTAVTSWFTGSRAPADNKRAPVFPSESPLTPSHH